ncbi:MAG: hypothetical protein PWR07_1266 [Bacillota bacterium]|nr:hypothetical protein [Bacillota bacterium]
MYFRTYGKVNQVLHGFVMVKMKALCDLSGQAPALVEISLATHAYGQFVPTRNAARAFFVTRWATYR